MVERKMKKDNVDGRKKGWKETILLNTEKLIFHYRYPLPVYSQAKPTKPKRHTLTHKHSHKDMYIKSMRTVFLV